MTEAELQRLAEIIAGLSSKPASPTYSYWQVLGAIIAGVLVSQITAVIGYVLGRRSRQREARVRLLYALTDHQWRLAVEHDLGIPLSPVTVQRVKQLSEDEVWQRILEAINAGNDWKYGRLIFEKMRFSVYQDSPKGRSSEFEAVRGIVTELEREALPLTGRLHDEFLTLMRTPKGYRRWLLKLKIRLKRFFGR